MLGRHAYSHPKIIHDFYNDGTHFNRFDIVSKYLLYIEKNIADVNFSVLARPMFNLYKSTPSSKKWKNGLSIIAANSSNKVGDLKHLLDNCELSL